MDYNGFMFKNFIYTILLTLIFIGILPFQTKAKENNMSIPDNLTQANAYQFSFTSIDGKDMPLSDFKGKVILIVNTASQCGFTKQYEDLQKLYETYKDQGFVVIGVPCNNFGGQEPESEDKISAFAKDQYGVTFPLTSKANVKGDDIHPFFKWAVDQRKGGIFFSKPKWNFHKFLIGKNGDLIESFGSQVSPSSDDITDEIEKALKN